MFSRMTVWKNHAEASMLTEHIWIVKGKLIERLAVLPSKADLIAVFVEGCVLEGCAHGKTCTLPNLITLCATQVHPRPPCRASHTPKVSGRICACRCHR